MSKYSDLAAAIGADIIPPIAADLSECLGRKEWDMVALNGGDLSDWAKIADFLERGDAKAAKAKWNTMDTASKEYAWDAKTDKLHKLLQG